jgi:ankyrin repeat protein
MYTSEQLTGHCSVPCSVLCTASKCKRQLLTTCTGTLLLAIADIRAVDDRFARTALHFACRAGGVNTLRLLLQRGADINAVTSVGNTGTTQLLPILVLLLLLLLLMLLLLL